jgi:hypothetical protein
LHSLLSLLWIYGAGSAWPQTPTPAAGVKPVSYWVGPIKQMSPAAVRASWEHTRMGLPAVPALIELRAESRPESRMLAQASLFEMGARARPAMPPALSDPRAQCA